MCYLRMAYIVIIMWMLVVNMTKMSAFTVREREEVEYKEAKSKSHYIEGGNNYVTFQTAGILRLWYEYIILNCGG